MTEDEAGYSYASNEESAEDLGWTPELWSMPGFGEDLSEQVKVFQAYEGLEPTGIVDSVTYVRALNWLGGMFWDPPEPGEAEPPAAVSDCILVGGRRLPIKWPRVVTPDEEGAFVIQREYEKGGKGHTRFRDREDGSIDRAGLHWTGTRSIQHTWRSAWSTKRSVSTHFEIDWDGTIYQLVDVAHRAYHYGIGWFNDRSVGVDLTNPVALKRTSEANTQLARLGQTKRPVLTDWWWGSWRPAMFLGPTDAQRKALRALMKALHDHVRIPLTAPLDDPKHPRHITPVKGYGGAICRNTKRNRELMPPGWYHHCQGRGNRWDHLGIYLTGELELAKGL